jgi:hypothetical protein
VKPVLVGEHGVDIPRRRDLKALHASRERVLGLGLDEHVDMGSLQADVHDPKPLAQRSDDRRLAHRLVHLASSQAANTGDDSHHDVERVSRLDLRPLLMPRTSPCVLRLAPGSLALPAAAKELLLNVPLARSLRRHLQVLDSHSHLSRQW